MSTFNTGQSSEAMALELQAKIEAESAEVEVEQNEQSFRGELKAKVLEHLLEEGIGDAELEEIRGAFPRFFAFPFQDTVYLLRGLDRLAWDNVSKLSGSELEFVQRLVKEATIFPIMDERAQETALAGVRDMLSLLIHRASGFLPPEEAINMVLEM